MLLSKKRGYLMASLKALFLKYKEYVLYVVFGCGTTAVNWIFTYTAQFILPHVSANVWFLRFDTTMICNAIGWIAGVIFAYVTNKLWVFESKSWRGKVVLREAVEFFGARGVTGLMEIFFPSQLMAWGLDQSVTIAGKTFEGVLAKLLVSVFVIILNYVFSKLVIFKKDKPQKAE